MPAQDRIELARYAHLPLGNLGGDWMLDVADAHLARCLRDAGHLLWISDPGLPDVAARADDDALDDTLLSEPAPLEVRRPSETLSISPFVSPVGCFTHDRTSAPQEPAPPRCTSLLTSGLGGAIADIHCAWKFVFIALQDL